MLGRSLASALLILACFAAAVAHSGPVQAEKNSDIQVGNTTYKIVDRIVLANVVVFHNPQNPKGQPCTIRHVTLNRTENERDCGVPAGRSSESILGCGGAVSSISETTAQTFARVPGKDAPNLFASIVSVHTTKKHNEGELEIAVLACGPRIAIPIAPDGPYEQGSSYKFNRISLSVSGSKRVAEFALRGIETRPETYRIAGMNEAVMFVVPFKALDNLQIEMGRGIDEAQTRSIELRHGEFVLGSYSAQNNRYSQGIERDVVPAGHPPVRVFISSR